jgi:hypothetical protein
MNRCALAALAIVALAVPYTVAAQAKTPAQAPATKAASATPAPAPATQAKWSKPVKGVATIDVIQGTPKKIGGDMVTVLKIKNTSAAPIALLKVDEFWYDKKMKIVSGDSQPPYKKPFEPGEIIEITMKSPIKPDLYRSNYAFKHANGDIKVTAVKKFQ